MTKITDYTGHDSIVEYVKTVDLNPYPVDLDRLRPCYRAVICTHLPKASVGVFTTKAQNRHLPSSFTLGMKSAGNRAWFSFTPRYAERPGTPPFTTNEASRAIMTLLSFLNLSDLPIIWKEDRFGYEIGPGGVIKRKWALLPDNVPF